MRRIKFRGKREEGNNGEWIYGCAVVFSEGLSGEEEAQIIQYKWHGDDEFYNEFVWPESVGQFTGLHDHEGNEIYEGDILQYGEKTGYVRFAKGSYYVMFDGDESLLVSCVFGGLVIGNIYDDEELLKSGWSKEDKHAGD